MAHPAGMKPDDYRWQDFVISPRRTATDLIATALVIVLSVSAVLASDRTQREDPAPVRTVEVAAPQDEAPPLAQSAKRPVIPRRTENCL